MIVVLDASSLGEDLDLSPLSRLPDCRIWTQSPDDVLVERIKTAKVIIANRIDLNARLLSEAKNLELIALTATGYNNVDLEYCAQAGISVANVSFYSTDSVAQHCFAMLFYLLEQTRYYDDYVRQARYNEDRRFAELSRPWFELKGKRWGIIGLGQIGRKVASVASAFGAEPVYYSTSGVSRTEEWPRLDLNELLATSDIISVHAPLNPMTESLLGRREFSLMKKNCFFLNLGRGAIIDEIALAETLSEDRIKGAGLDVLTEEPPSEDNPLLGLIGPRLLITPHNAWGSIESRTHLINEVAENVRAHLRGEKRNLVEQVK